MLIQRSHLIGLLGSHIQYSLSPTIHNFSMQHLGIAGHYELFDFPKRDAAAFLRLITQLPGAHLSITQPYKNLAARVLHSKLRSINTIYWRKNSLATASTDGSGLRQACERQGLHLKSFSKIVFVGGGQATVALVEDFRQHLGSRKLDMHVVRRKTFPKGFAKSQNIQLHPFSVKAIDALLRNSDPRTLLIHATSAPHLGNDLRMYAKNMADFQGTTIDLNYRNHSAFYLEARRLGMPHLDGLPMLIEQARAAQTLWWNTAASFERIAQHLASLKVFDNQP